MITLGQTRNTPRNGAVSHDRFVGAPAAIRLNQDLDNSPFANATAAVDLFYDQVLAAGVDIIDLGLYVPLRSLVLDCILCGAWNSIYAMYPLVGGTAGAHSINLKTPGTRSITWSGTVTHDANGIVGDGATGSGNCGFNLNNVTNSLGNIALGCFTTNIVNASDAWGFGSSGADHRIASRSNGSAYGFYIGSNTAHFLNVAATPGQMLIWAGGSNSRKGYNTAKALTSDGTSFTTTVAANRFRFCSANTGASGFSQHRMTFGWVGTSFTDQMASGVYDAIQRFHVTLGRAS